jgi:hypothetical protein
MKDQFSHHFKIAHKIIRFLNIKICNSRSYNLLDETSIRIIVAEFKQRDLTLFKPVTNKDVKVCEILFVPFRFGSISASFV